MRPPQGLALLLLALVLAALAGEPGGWCGAATKRGVTPARDAVGGLAARGCGRSRHGHTPCTIAVKGKERRAPQSGATCKPPPPSRLWRQTPCKAAAQPALLPPDRGALPTPTTAAGACCAQADEGQPGVQALLYNVAATAGRLWQARPGCLHRLSSHQADAASAIPLYAGRDLQQASGKKLPPPPKKPVAGQTTGKKPPPPPPKKPVVKKSPPPPPKKAGTCSGTSCSGPGPLARTTDSTLCYPTECCTGSPGKWPSGRRPSVPAAARP